ncbi:SecDF P1 head subdomain-containing protein [Phytohabitans suffuscus]|uniref:SecDF P1 head subdomain domain-containing protein n=1 Tax=Phytohabitans suffuscus TaxID=624315 RepID=A0A6F8YTZ2_9ACTN|nr:hypothetical protein [Phytohabitans suffuscus]BCB89607.1 hypothetical protein Psuf_069200 [Phytohabitans suffuscus]
MSTQDSPSGYPQPVAPPGLGYVPEGYLPPPGSRRPRRWRWWLAAGVAVVLAAGTTAAVLLLNRSDGGAATGDVAVTLRAFGPDGGRAATAALDETKRILLSRMAEAEVTRPTITIVGNETLVVTAAPKHAERVKSLLTPGNVTFRKVLSSTPDPAGGPDGCQPDPADRPDRQAALTSAKAKLGTAFDAADRIQDPTRADVQALSAFGTLTCAEVEALPARMQYMVPTLGCRVLNGRVPGALNRADETAAACDREGTTKYLLDEAKVVGADLAGAEASLDPQRGDWIVTMRFTGGGQPKWTELTREVADEASRSGQIALVAVASDNEVITAPSIENAIQGDAVISGSLDRERATLLAANLNHGVLPLRLVIASIDTVR